MIPQIQPLLTCPESEAKYKQWPEGSKDAAFEEPPVAEDSDKKCDILSKLCKIYRKILFGLFGCVNVRIRH